jgi:hypothetical protein
MTGSVKSWRQAFAAAVAIAVGIIAFLAYSVVDQGVTITHLSEGYSRSENDLKVLADAFPRDRYNKKDVVAVLRKSDPKGFIVETKCAVQLNGLRFEFDSAGRLVNVNTEAGSSSDYPCPATGER